MSLLLGKSGTEVCWETGNLAYDHGCVIDNAPNEQATHTQLRARYSYFSWVRRQKALGNNRFSRMNFPIA